jgi:hypothetical protein
VCGNAARTDLRGGRRAISVPTEIDLASSLKRANDKIRDAEIANLIGGLSLELAALKGPLPDSSEGAN